MKPWRLVPMYDYGANRWMLCWMRVMQQSPLNVQIGPIVHKAAPQTADIYANGR